MRIFCSNYAYSGRFLELSTNRSIPAWRGLSKGCANFVERKFGGWAKKPLEGYNHVERSGKSRSRRLGRSLPEGLCSRFLFTDYTLNSEINRDLDGSGRSSNPWFAGPCGMPWRRAKFDATLFYVPATVNALTSVRNAGMPRQARTYRGIRALFRSRLANGACIPKRESCVRGPRKATR